MNSHFDTICALISPPGTAAVNLLRISGSRAREIVAKSFSQPTKLLSAPGHTILYGTFSEPGGDPIDEVLIFVYAAPRSYTGEDVLEISCHGNPLISGRILEVLLRSARQAEPGEFTKRAYLNGKLDLIRAEAVDDLINARSIRSESSALMQVQGYLTRHLATLMEGIRNARIRLELAIDFSDQDLPQLDIDSLTEDISVLHRSAKALYHDSRGGKYLREGVRICLSGAPNVGKSSLFNALLRENRAIVSPHPGTTRDYLEESISIDGYTMIFYDTAGLRDSADEIERIGISRTLDIMKSADLVINLLSLEDYAALKHTQPAGNEIRVITKVDLLGYPEMPSPSVWEADLSRRFGTDQQDTPLPLSSLLHEGLQPLTKAMIARLSIPELRPESPIITNSRQLASLANCIDALGKALAAMQNEMGFEFAAFDLIAADSALQEILGISTTDDMLGEIFANFCIGK